MGRALAARARQLGGFKVVGGIDAHDAGEDAALAAGYPRIASIASADTLIEAADVVLDFSAPDALRALLGTHGPALHGRALVTGTTGLSAQDSGALDALAASCAVLDAPNFSIGVNVLLALVERAARALPADAWDAEIVETHHGGKVDAPSGTALALGDAVARGRGSRLEDERRDGRSGVTGARRSGEIGFHALRGGGVVGEHSVSFLGPRERVVLEHQAFDRALFADGALTAARWLAGRDPGRYSMAEALGL